MVGKRSLALVLLTAGLVTLVLSMVREEGRVAHVAPGAQQVEPQSGADDLVETASVVRSAVLVEDAVESLDEPVEHGRLGELPSAQRWIAHGVALGQDGGPIWQYPATLEVLVRGAAGEPIARHTVEVVALRVGQSMAASWSRSTDDSGWCEFADVPSGVALSMRLYRGEVLLRTWSDGLELRPGERRRVEWVPSGVGGCTLTGQVFDEDGSLVDGLEISLARSAQRGRHVESVGVAVVDAVGRFELAGVPPGVLWFQVTRGEAALTVEPGFVHVKHEDQQRFVELRVRGALFLRGSVVGPAEEPVEGAAVRATGRSTGSFADCRTDEQGAFELGPLADDEYRIEASGRARIDGSVPLAEQRAHLAFVGDAQPVLVRAGDEGIVLRLQAAGSLSGTLRAEAGEELDRASVTAQLFVSGRPERSFSATGGESFSLARLPTGSYHVAVTTDRGLFGARADVVVIGGEETEVELTLKPGARLVVIPAPGRPEILRAWSGEVLACNVWIDADEPTEVVVPAGELRVEILENSAALRVVHERSIEVDAGESYRIDSAALTSSSEAGR